MGLKRGIDCKLYYSITGVAGPGGGSEVKPVGLVYMGVAREGGETRAVRDRKSVV